MHDGVSVHATSIIRDAASVSREVNSMHDGASVHATSIIRDVASVQRE